jgi:hypothetical protein
MLSFIIFYVECHYAECYYVECHYAECRGTLVANIRQACEQNQWRKKFLNFDNRLGGLLYKIFDCYNSCLGVVS